MLAREHDRVTLVAQPVPGPDFRLLQHVYATTYLLWYVVAVKARLSARKVLRTALAADPVTSLELTHTRHLWRRLRPVHGRRGQRTIPSLACPHARFFFLGELWGEVCHKKETMPCDRDPAAFRYALLDTAQRYHRVAVVKYWHTCCDRCLASPPVLCVESKMTLADVTFAHGMSLQGSIKMLRSLPNDGNADMTTAIDTLTRFPCSAPGLWDSPSDASVRGEAMNRRRKGKASASSNSAGDGGAESSDVVRWRVDMSSPSAKGVKMQDYDDSLVTRLEDAFEEVGDGTEIKATFGSNEYLIFYDIDHKDGAIWKQVRCDNPKLWRYVERVTPAAPKRQRTDPVGASSNDAPSGPAEMNADIEEEDDEPAYESRPSCGVAQALLTQRGESQDTGADVHDEDTGADAHDEDNEVVAEVVAEVEAEVEAEPGDDDDDADSDETREM